MISKVKHLEFAQGAVERMARNSFLLKGWSLTVLLALLVFVKDSNVSALTTSITIIIGFYVLDVYYLYQEKLFRNLYNNIVEGSVGNFSMKTTNLFKELCSSIFSLSMLFYVFLITVVYIINR